MTIHRCGSCAEAYERGRDEQAREDVAIYRCGCGECNFDRAVERIRASRPSAFSGADETHPPECPSHKGYACDGHAMPIVPDSVIRGAKAAASDRQPDSPETCVPRRRDPGGPLMDFASEARALCGCCKCRNHGPNSQCVEVGGHYRDHCEVERNEAALRRAAEEAEMRAFGDRAKMRAWLRRACDFALVAAAGHAASLDWDGIARDLASALAATGTGGEKETE